MQIRPIPNPATPDRRSRCRSRRSRRLPVLLLLLGVLAGTLSARGLPSDSLPEGRLLNRAVLYGAGVANLYDTYLSPLEYRGPELRVSREAVRLTRLGGGQVRFQNLFTGSVAYATSSAGNNRTFGSDLNWTCLLHYPFRLTDRFTLLAGGGTELNGGFFYNLRNGNNPASARVYASANASVQALWRVRIRRWPLLLRWQADVPLAGVRFSPHYGQSYYEIFTLGNHAGTVCFTSLHNSPSLRQLVSADFPVGRSTLRLVYTARFDQSRLHGLYTHSYSHAFQIGFVYHLWRSPALSHLKSRNP